MFPWLIWLCMAGTAKGTIPSPLLSSAYIRLTGTSHFHWYYGAIRLPTTLLRPSFRCVHIPRFTRFHGRCRLSPVDKDSIVQHEQVSDTAVASSGSPRIACFSIVFPASHWVDPRFFSVSVLNTVPTVSLTTLHTRRYRRLRRFGAGCWAVTYPDRISTGLLSCPLLGARRVDEPLARLAPHRSRRAAFPHWAPCKVDTSHQFPYILT